MLNNKNIILKIKNIHKKFYGQEILKGISCQAKEGDVVSILGASGSGKSTFLRCINFLEIADEGEIELLGSKIDLEI